MPRLEGGACGHGRRTTKHNRGDVEKISTPHPQNAHQNSTKSHKDEGMCAFWGWGGSWKGALFTVWSPPAPHSLSHFKQSYWQGSGSSPFFQGHWSFKEVKEGSSLEATGPRLAYLASVVARWSGHIGKTLACRPMQMAPVAAFLGVDLSLCLPFFLPTQSRTYALPQGSKDACEKGKRMLVVFEFGPLRKSEKEMPAVPGRLYACARAMLGHHHHGIRKSPADPLFCSAKTWMYRWQMHRRMQKNMKLYGLLKKEREREKKYEIPCCSVPGLWGPEIRFCGCVKRSQNIWRRIRQAPLHSCLHPAKTYPPFPCSIDVYTHRHTRPPETHTRTHTHTHTHIYLKIIKCFRFNYGLHDRIVRSNMMMERNNIQHIFLLLQILQASRSVTLYITALMLLL